MRRIVQFKKYQPLGVDFILQRQRGNLFAGMGMGKGLISLTALDTLMIAGMVQGPTLVLGPKRVAESTWSDEAAKWDHLKDISVSPVVGTLKQRIAALKRSATVYTCNYEQLPWLVSYLGEAWPFETVIADESTRLKSFRLKQGGKRAHALHAVAHTKVNRWINLTGTPSPNGLLDLWGQMWFIDQGTRLGRSFTAFQNRWFYREADSGDFGPLLPHKHAEKEIYALIKDVCLTLDPKDWFDLKEPVFNTVEVKLSPATMKRYKEFEDTMFTELANGSEIEVFNAAALTNKCLQFANGAVYDGDGYTEVHNAKLEALESIVSESGGMPVLVAYSFVSDKERILEAFPKTALLSTPEGMKAFKSGNAPIGLAHPKSMGHGIDGLQDVTNILARFGHDWNLEERMQMLERIGPVRQAQSGHNRPVLVYDIVAKNTIDETVLERHITKRKVQDLLLEAMK
jgi:SNF2 family DNA or RNA helicase